MNQIEERYVREFATKVIAVVHEYRGKLSPGLRCFWLLSAALATLDEESKSRIGVDGFVNAARVAFYQVRSSLGPRFW